MSDQAAHWSSFDRWPEPTQPDPGGRQENSATATHFLYTLASRQVVVQRGKIAFVTGPFHLKKLFYINHLIPEILGSAPAVLPVLD